MNNDLVNKLAIAFSNILKSWLTEEEMKEVIRINSLPGMEKLCQSHEYCDANMAMNEAFMQVMGRSFVFYDDEKPETLKQNEEDTDFFNAAWDLAKSNQFYL